jgi:chromosomal replication initiation ATPase DnaA
MDAEWLAGRGRAFRLDLDGAAPSFSQAAQRTLLHLFNLVAQRQGHLLICARLPPARWALSLPDLRSRLAAAPAVRLDPPDEGLLAALLLKLFADRQLVVEPEVVEYLVPRMERSFEAAGRLVQALDAASLAARRRVTLPLAREVLGREGQAGMPAAES